MRHTRQARLAEIGAEGQARLGRSEVSVSSGGISGDVCARYLAAAGVGVVRTDGARVVQNNSEFDIVDPAARELASGAHEALRTIRSIVLRGVP